LSNLEDVSASLKQTIRDQMKRRGKIQKFITQNSPLVNAEDLTKGSTIWIFSGAPQYYISRAKVLYTSPSNSDKMITLYLEDDNKYEKWREKDSWENRMHDFDENSVTALRVSPNKYYKSVKRDKKIPLG
jgi:hypothetical protein